MTIIFLNNMNFLFKCIRLNIQLSWIGLSKPVLERSERHSDGGGIIERRIAWCWTREDNYLWFCWTIRLRLVQRPEEQTIHFIWKEKMDQFVQLTSMRVEILRWSIRSSTRALIFFFVWNIFSLINVAIWNIIHLSYNYYSYKTHELFFSFQMI